MEQHAASRPDPASAIPLGAREAFWFARAIDALQTEGIPYLIGGAFGLYHYTGLWRGTKDLDLLILPEDRDRTIASLTEAGLADMYAQEPYDRGWIYRSIRESAIIDVIWSFANRVDCIQPEWFGRSSDGRLLGFPVQIVSAADLCWMKLFVFQSRRCDWPDLLNIIRGMGGELDWNLLLTLAGPHWRLVGAVVEIWDWLCPQERHVIPAEVRETLEELRRQPDPSDECRDVLLDSRPWLTELGAGDYALA